MKYAYEDLGEDQFENLIVCICKEIFGIGTQGFAKGPDGGRDAKFVGTAQFFPSTASPWSGTTIIQAKHVNAYNKSFSDPDFYGNKKSVLGDELPKIKKLRERGELDNYLLFSNRKLTANAESVSVYGFLDTFLLIKPRCSRPLSGWPAPLTESCSRGVQ